jgi:hypothetical protein
MRAAERKARDNRLGLFSRNDLAIPQRVVDNAIVDLRVKRALIKRDSSSAVPAFGKGLAEAAHHIFFSATLSILQRDQEPARRRLVVLVIDSAPRVRVNRAAGCDGELLGEPDAVSEDRGAEALWQRDPAIVGRAVRSAVGLSMPFGSTTASCQPAGMERLGAKRLCERCGL